MEKKKTGIKVSVLALIMLAFVAAICSVLVIWNFRAKDYFAKVKEFDSYYKQCSYQGEQMKSYVDELQGYMDDVLLTESSPESMKKFLKRIEAKDAEEIVAKVKAITADLKNLDDTDKDELTKNYGINLEKIPAQIQKLGEANKKIMQQMYIFTVLNEKEANKGKSEKEINDAVNALRAKFPETVTKSAAVPSGADAKPMKYLKSARQQTARVKNEELRGINSNINGFSDRIKGFADDNLDKQQDKLESVILEQQIFCIVMVFGMIFIVIILYKMVITVLRHYVRQIISTKDLKPEGVYELRYLADAYNEKFEKIEKKEQSLIRRADYDSLTNIYNRGAFETAVNGKLKLINDNTSAFVLFNVDNFKKVNDEYGHEMGDKILTLIAYTLKESFGEDDILGRINGDEFGVFIPSVPEEDLTYVKERVANINRQMSAANASFPSITFSVGISLNFQGDTFKDAYGRADDALYYVKSHGKCGCRIYGSNS